MALQRRTAGTTKRRIVVLLAEVEAWRAASRCLLGWLGGAERARLEALRRPSDRDATLLAHGLLRLALAELTGTGPETAEVETPRGRPPQAAFRSELSLSLAHTTGLAAAAAAIGVAVGVDVEAYAAGAPVDELVDTVLSPAERGDLLELPRGRRPTALVRAFSRKEAVLKAAGVGLAAPLTELEVGVGPASATPRRVALRRRRARSFMFVDLDAPSGFHAALAWGGGRRTPLLDVRRPDARAWSG
jgi:4'-phosphopantetheinyl transferase